MALPSGALGNAVSALFAQRMGLPIDIVVCNTAANNVTSHFVRTGEFRARPAVTTIAPAIDIGDPYNIQRVFYYLCGGKTDTVRQWMSQWTAGHFQLDAAHLDAFRRLFHVTEASEAEMAAAIRTTYEQHSYLLDPHTAVAWVGAHKLAAAGTVDLRRVCVVATASPLKFLSTVQECIPGVHIEPDSKLAALDEADHSIAADQTSTDACVAAVSAVVEQLAQRLRSTDILP
jgi:threonine synthase